MMAFDKLSNANNHIKHAQTGITFVEKTKTKEEHCMNVMCEGIPSEIKMTSTSKQTGLL